MSSMRYGVIYDYNTKADVKQFLLVMWDSIH